MTRQKKIGPGTARHNMHSDTTQVSQRELRDQGGPEHIVSKLLSTGFMRHSFGWGTRRHALGYLFLKEALAANSGARNGILSVIVVGFSMRYPPVSRKLAVRICRLPVAIK